MTRAVYSHTTLNAIQYYINDSLSNPNIMWYSLKCFLTWQCIEYTSRKKKEIAKAKCDLTKEIEKVRKNISDFDEEDGA